jgi:hypothetical protein
MSKRIQIQREFEGDIIIKVHRISYEVFSIRIIFYSKLNSIEILENS